ncbi:hypothetical protein KAT92_01390 [Candidatus Babeliales bacterium]|nr:hypothetical protein [Candidatus Babeliales bacterium]
MKFASHSVKTLMLLACLGTLFLFGCGKEKRKDLAQAENDQTKELDFQVKNETGKTIYVTCFSYIQKGRFSRWRWDKSPVYKLEQNKSVFINIDTIPDKEHREHTFAYLAVFSDEAEANQAIYELLEDQNKIDLDQVYNLFNKQVIVTVEKYGFKEEQIDFAIVKKLKKEPPPELDFVIENQTGKTIYVCCFVHQVKDDIRSVWAYDKTTVQKLMPNQSSLINIDTITNQRNRNFVPGYLAVFEEHEEKEARESTYELLKPKNKIVLGRLSYLKEKKAVIEVEKYGAVGDITEITIKPVSHVLEQLNLKQEPVVKTITKKKTQAKQPTKKSIIKPKRKYKLFT